MLPQPSVLRRFVGPALTSLATRDLRLVRAVRAWSMARIGGVAAGARLEALLGTRDAATAFDRYMDAALVTWPEPPLVCRPCCGVASFDECTLAAMVVLAGRTDRARFDSLTHEMLGEAARNLLYARALAVAGAL